MKIATSETTGYVYYMFYFLGDKPRVEWQKVKKSQLPNLEQDLKDGIAVEVEDYELV